MNRRTLRRWKQSLALLTGRRRPEGDVPHLQVRPKDREQFESWSFFNTGGLSRPRILMSSGFGYGNVGDEAQLGACISRWKRVAPDCSITLLSPSPPYTSALHGERVEWASRVAWFRANTIGPYFDEREFPGFFRLLKWRLELSARTARADIPFSLTTPREARLIQLFQEHDLLHISGGGFLTGKTRSRLWDNCLLMRLCQLLGKPYLLTGHNIGVFQDRHDRRLAVQALSKAFWIGLRDRGLSEAELSEVGICGQHVLSSCDDALFCNRMERNELEREILSSGGNPQQAWAAVNFHHWGQPESERPANEQRYAELCDILRDRHGLQVVFIAMTPTDVAPAKAVISRMRGPAVLLSYSPDYRVVRGVIAESQLVFTMKHHPIVFAQGEGVPVVSVALDDYYLRKNIGAMENTGHARFMMDRSTFESKSAVTLLAEALGKRDEIGREMRAWTDSMRALEMDPYRAAMRQLKLAD